MAVQGQYEYGLVHRWARLARTSNVGFLHCLAGQTLDFGFRVVVEILVFWGSCFPHLYELCSGSEHGWGSFLTMPALLMALDVVRV
jgi:hypothetical protein